MDFLKTCLIIDSFMHHKVILTVFESFVFNFPCLFTTYYRSHPKSTISNFLKKITKLVTFKMGSHHILQTLKELTGVKGTYYKMETSEILQLGDGGTSRTVIKRKKNTPRTAISLSPSLATQFTKSFYACNVFKLLNH